MASERISIPIDKAGRIVLPKEIRDRIGVQAGEEFEVIEESDRIILKPVVQEPRLVNKKGILVVVPEKGTEKSVPDFVRERREERIRKFL